jgi:hypothetical protein
MTAVQKSSSGPFEYRPKVIAIKGNIGSHSKSAVERQLFSRNYWNLRYSL